MLRSTLSLITLLCCLSPCLGQEALRIDFEGERTGRFSAGELTADPQHRIAGERSLQVSSRGHAQEWFEFFTAGGGALTPGFVYTATLRYRVIDADPKTTLYALYRSSGKGWGRFDRGWKTTAPLADQVGQVGELTISAGLDNRYDYELMLGLHGPGQVVIDDVVITAGEAYHEDDDAEAFAKAIPAEARRAALLDFEGEVAGKLAAGMGSITRADPISGAASLLGDSTGSDQTWNIFYTGERGGFAPDNRYYISFSYRVPEDQDAISLYLLIRSRQKQDKDVALQRWKLPAGAAGTLHFKTTVYWPLDDYALSFGLVGKGRVLLDEVEIMELERGPNTALLERPTFDKSKAELVWAEEFDGPLDPERWTIAGDSRRRGGMWRKRNMFTEDGKLVVRFDKSDGTYNGGCVTSKERFTYGYFEARIKFNKHPGHWLGFWLMDGAVNRVGNDGRDGTEIDIVESPWRGTGKASHALHWDGYVFYVNGVETWRTYAGEGCQVPLSILISDELGGWSGTPRDDTLPDDSFVDYVRVYR